MRCLLVGVVFLTGCSFQMGMSTPRDYYTKAEVKAALDDRDKAIVNLANAIKMLQPEVKK